MKTLSHLWRGQHGDAPGAPVPVPAEVAEALAALPAEAVQFGERVVGQVVAGVVGLSPVVVVLLAGAPVGQIMRLEHYFLFET